MEYGSKAMIIHDNEPSINCKNNHPTLVFLAHRVTKINNNTELSTYPVALRAYIFKPQAKC